MAQVGWRWQQPHNFALTTHQGSVDPTDMSKPAWEHLVRTAIRQVAFHRLATRRPKYDGIQEYVDWDLIRQTIKALPTKFRPTAESVLVG